MTEQELQEALKRWKFASESENVWRRECLNDLVFSLGEIDGISTQWASADRIERANKKRPCLTINRMPQFTNQVTNEGRQNRASINVIPVDDDADVDTAEILQGMCRYIERNSFADIAYGTARGHMVKMGFGYTRLLSDYCDAETFDQEIKIARVMNPFSVYYDPGAQEPDYSDAQYAFVHQTLTKEQHKQRWPKAGLSNMQGFSGIGDSLRDWVTGENNIRVAEYFRIEYEARELIALGYEDQSGEVVGFRDEFPAEVPAGARILRSRKVRIPRVRWSIINGYEELEEKGWPGKYIPIIPWIGNEEWIEGRRHISGMIRSARPAHQMYNYWVSALTEMVGTLPKAPYMAEVGQIEGLETIWQNANTEIYGVLPYRAVSVDGHPLPPPQRQFAEPPIQAITAAVIQADRDLKATFGIYEAGLGQRGPQESGRAIMARKSESDMGTYHYADQEARAIRFGGRQLINLIPHYWDAPRIARIVLPDDTESKVPLYQKTKWKGIERVFDLRVGQYDVAITTGPSYESKRQQAADQQTNLIKSFPDIMPVAGDLMVRNMDIPGSKEIADRLKKTLPPNLQDNDEEQPIPPAFLARMAAMEQQHEQLVAALNEANDKIEKEQVQAETKLQIAQMQEETKRQVAALNARIELLKTEATVSSAENVALLKAEIETIRSEVERMEVREVVQT